MGVKYYILLKDDYNTEWRADIDLPGYDGPSIMVRGFGRKGIIPEWETEDIDDPFNPIINSKVTLSFHNEEHAQVDVEELQLLRDLTGRVHIYKEDVLWWTGYIQSDGIQRKFKPLPYEVNITAIDGLAILEDIPFMGINNHPMQSGVQVRSPLAYIREVLFRSQHLNLPLPIRWASEVECTYFPGEDAIAGSVKWGPRGESYTDGNGNRRSCMYVLKGMVDAFGCRIFQFGGRWHILRTADIISGVYDWKELSTDYGTGTPTETSGTENALDTYRIINENHIITIKPALTDAIVRYDHAIPENILPNGSMDTWISAGQILINWDLTTSPTGASMSRGPDLTNREGSSVILEYDYQGGSGPDAIFQMNGGDGNGVDDLGLPLDANILFKRMTFGFTISPTNGFPYDDNGIINWDSKPLRIRVKYNIDDGAGTRLSYYLNSYGYWQYLPPFGYLRITDYTENTSGGVRSMHYTFNGTPLAGDIIKLNYHADGPPPSDQEAKITVEEAEQGDMVATLEKLADEISVLWTTEITNLGLGAYMFTVRAEDSFTNSGHHVGSGFNTLDPDLTIPLTIEGARIYDIIKFEFQGKGGNSDILIPDPGILDGSGDARIGKMYIEFFLEDGQRYLLDEVWMNVDDNNDVYRSYTPTGNGTNKREKQIEVSSSFTGAVVSNFMTIFTMSNQQFVFSDGRYQGSLTGMYANAMMRFRSKANKIFNGDIYTDGKDWKFTNIYNFEGLSNINFLPLNAKYNIETGIVEIIAIEGRDDTETAFLEDHYGSNSKLLSETN